MKKAKKFTLFELSQATNAQLVGNAEHLISGVEALEAASIEDVSFLANPRYRELMLRSQAGVVCIDKAIPLIEGKNFLVSENPSRTFQQIIELLFADCDESGFKGIHPTAVIHPETEIGKEVQIGPYVVIDRGAKIGNRTRLDAFVSIGSEVEIGDDCHFYPHATIRERSLIGNRVIIQPGAVIGSCGFGYTTDAKGTHTKLDQLGIVVLEDDVEIGANTTVDRARFKETRISRGTKIDNLVQIGHNVILGEHNIIVSQTGIAGSAKTGRNVVMGGQAGVVGHVEIADYVMIATRGGVSKSMPEKGKYAGGPAMPLAEYNRQQVYLRNIASYVKKIEQLETRLSELEKQASATPTQKN